MRKGKNNKLNIVLVGDEGVGKHELIHAITHGELESLVTDFEENELGIELDGVKRHVVLTCSGDDENANLLLILRAHVVVLCYGIDSNESLGSIATMWVPKLNEYVPDTPTYLLGCKSDLRDDDPNEVEVDQKRVLEVSNMIRANQQGSCSSVAKTNLLETLVGAIRIAVNAMADDEETNKKCIIS